jgi:DNA polymerase-3 subunit epsilon
MKNINFVAIDFETANESRASVCQVGLSFVENGKIVDTRSWLVRPKDNRYVDFNITIHGIGPGDTVDKPEFDVIWKELYPLIEGKILIAHNAAFDMHVLRQTLDLYDLVYPNINTVCSCILSKRAYPGLLSHSLENMAHELDIMQNSHHDAGDDARVCAEICLKAFQKDGMDDFSKITDMYRIIMGTMSYDNRSYIGPRSKREYTQKQKVDAKTIVTSKHDPDNLFYDRHVVFTGTLLSMERKDAMQIIADLGGYPENGINSRTNFLIVGQQDFKIVDESGLSGKQKKAAQLFQKGQDIEIISEDDFLKNIPVIAKTESKPKTRLNVPAKRPEKAVIHTQVPQELFYTASKMNSAQYKQFLEALHRDVAGTQPIHKHDPDNIFYGKKVLFIGFVGNIRYLFKAMDCLGAYPRSGEIDNDVDYAIISNAIIQETALYHALYKEIERKLKQSNSTYTVKYITEKQLVFSLGARAKETGNYLLGSLLKKYRTLEQYKDAEPYYLVFDCETTGFFSERFPSYIIQLAWILLDSEYNTIREESFYVKPPVPIPFPATRVNRITNEMVAKQGTPLEVVLGKFHKDRRQAKKLIAHNFEFDSQFVDFESKRVNLYEPSLNDSDYYCTMRESTEYCQVLGKSGGYKVPKLEELAAKLDIDVPDNMHNALVDCRVTAQCAKKLSKLLST